MKMTMRWFGPDDLIPLQHIRQIPGMTGVVSAIYDVPVGEVWPLQKIRHLRKVVNDGGLDLPVIESIPVHEEIKLGGPDRDRYIEAYCESVRNLGLAGIPVLCYNFMPVFDWTRTDLVYEMADGSTALQFSAQDLLKFATGSEDDLQLPGWAMVYTKEELSALLTAFRGISHETLWENLAYFLKRVIPVAEAAGVMMAIHPDDPPWDIFGMPRIITDAAALRRLTGLVDSPANGITFCTGSLGALSSNDLPAMIAEAGDRIHFVHMRNVAVKGAGEFHESAHPTGFGNVNMHAVMEALLDIGFDGPIRPDHGRMIWGEQGRPGYGLYDRALGAMYLQGLREGLATRRSA